MPTATTIVLPKSLSVRFPDRCISCGCAHPGTLRMWTGTSGWLTLRMLGWHPTDVPVCDGCRRGVRWQRWARSISACAMGAIGTPLAWHLGLFKGPFRHLIGFGIAAVVSIPFVLWDTFFPALIDISADGDRLFYYFLDVAYAGEFAELNLDEANPDLG